MPNAKHANNQTHIHCSFSSNADQNAGNVYRSMHVFAF